MVYQDDDTEPMSSLAVARLLNGSPGVAFGVFRIPAWCHGERSMDYGMQGGALVYTHPTGAGVGVRCLSTCSDAEARQALLEAVQSVMSVRRDIQLEAETLAAHVTAHLAGRRIEGDGLTLDRLMAMYQVDHPSQTFAEALRRLGWTSIRSRSDGAQLTRWSPPKTYSAA